RLIRDAPMDRGPLLAPRLGGKEEEHQKKRAPATTTPRGGSAVISVSTSLCDRESVICNPLPVGRGPSLADIETPESRGSRTSAPFRRREDTAPGRAPTTAGARRETPRVTSSVSSRGATPRSGRATSSPPPPTAASPPPRGTRRGRP